MQRLMEALRTPWGHCKTAGGSAGCCVQQCTQLDARSAAQLHSTLKQGSGTLRQANFHRCILQSCAPCSPASQNRRPRTSWGG